MTKFKKIVAAALTSAAVSVSIGITACAVTSSNQVVGNYCAFEWSSGYAQTTNITSVSRKAYAVVEVYKDVTGMHVETIQESRIIGYNGFVCADARNYPSSGYNFKCSGWIHGGTADSTPKIESFSHYID